MRTVIMSFSVDKYNVALNYYRFKQTEHINLLQMEDIFNEISSEHGDTIERTDRERTKQCKGANMDLGVFDFVG